METDTVVVGKRSKKFVDGGIGLLRLCLIRVCGWIMEEKERRGNDGVKKLYLLLFSYPFMNRFTNSFLSRVKNKVIY